MEVYSRKILSMKFSNTLDKGSSVEDLEEAIPEQRLYGLTGEGKR